MPADSLSRRLGEHIVHEKDAHDLSRNPEFASFQFIGYRTSATAVELVALCDADGFTEGDVVRRRDEFFALVRRLPQEYGLKPNGRNPNGLLGFVFAEGCPEPMSRFIARQTRISHAAGTGGVSVAWAIDVPARRIHTHDNPVSIFPPVVIAARTVYPGLDYLESLLANPDTLNGSSMTTPPQQSEPNPEAYDAFISYASEDTAVALPLAQALHARGISVWLDELVLDIGDSRREGIDRGLASSRFGIVLVSRSFVQNPGTQRELNGLIARELSEGRTVVLPVWHEITANEVRAYSPPLADKVSLSTAIGVPLVADKITRFFHSLPALPGRPAPDAVPPRGQPRADGAEPIHILFLAADPTRSPIDLEHELERIETNLRMAKGRDRLHLKQVWAGSFDRLSQAMLDDAPTIVHFAGHGRQEGLVLRGTTGEPHVVPIKTLANLIGMFRQTVRCVVLNACWTEAQAHAIREHIPHVIATTSPVTDATAVAFSTGFYQAIGAGQEIPFAYQMGILHAQDKGGGDADRIILLPSD